MQKDQIKKSKDLNYYLMKFQKPIILALFFIMVALIVYSLIFFTPFYDMYLLRGKTFSQSNFRNWGLAYTKGADSTADLVSWGSGTNTTQYTGDALFYKESSSGSMKFYGLNMAYFCQFTENIQSFNHWLFKFGIIGLLVSLVLFIYRSQKRKRYYVTNFVAGGLVLGFDLFVGLSMLTKLINWNNVVRAQDYAVLNAFQSDLKVVPIADPADPTASIVEYYSAEKCQWIFNLGYVIAGIIIALVVLGIAFYVLKFIYQKKHKAIDVSGVVINE